MIDFKSMPAEIETRGETRRLLRYYRRVYLHMPRMLAYNYRIVHRDRVLYQAKNLILWITH